MSDAEAPFAALMLSLGLILLTPTAAIAQDGVEDVQALFDQALECGYSAGDIAGAARKLQEAARIAPEDGRVRLYLARAYRSGASTAYIARKLSPGAVTLLRVLVHGGWCLAKAAALLVLSLGKGRASAARALALASFGAGRIGGLAGLHYSEYRVIHGS